MPSNNPDHPPSKYLPPLPNFWLPTFIKNQFLTTIPPPKYTQVQSKTAIITGSNTGLGFEASRQLISLGLSHLIMGVRNLQKGREAARKLEQEGKGVKIDVWELDMCEYDSIWAFAKKCGTLEKVDLVILNAGLSPSKFETVKGTGHELAVQVNHFSTALLTLLIIPILKTKSSNPHISIVNSLTAHLCAFPNHKQNPLLPSFDDPANFISPSERYGVSKLLNQLFVVRLSEKICADDVVINMVDPGLTSGTNLGGHHNAKGLGGMVVRTILKMVGRRVEEGAATYTDAVFGHGRESHGCFLMSCEIAP
ncbi:uncharacterized protein FIESC28_04898 [Fusarium coffeatum]|uniref:Uncharacterized protein n=1 Tax=Fusarium coffeatum TaxID=231269 RepID=A0A366RWC1_9HYPO|nr:uncharacterized protein FIESC28_04898 [Fusarium coffeatum]RBR21361.1 hypothetical protein FIESC28_04898 [Fusarium coffeatum]